MNRNFYKKEFLSGAILTVFMGVACVMALLHLRQAVSGLETPVPQDLVQGKWCPQVPFHAGKRLSVPRKIKDFKSERNFVDPEVVSSTRYL